MNPIFSEKIPYDASSFELQKWLGVAYEGNKEALFPVSLSKKNPRGKLDFHKNKKATYSLHFLENRNGRKLENAEVERVFSKKINFYGSECRAKELYQVKKSRSYHYLLKCNDSFEYKSYPVELRRKKGEVSGSEFLYRFNKKNNLLFKGMDVGESKNLLFDSSLYIHADFKYFFTLGFGENDIRSVIRNDRKLPTGVEADVAFFLKLLFFKIDLSLITDVYFYKNLVRIPMKMHLPKNAFDYVNEDSYIFYEWEVSKDTQEGAVMPSLAYFHEQKQTADDVIKNYCDGSSCRFELSYAHRESNVTLGFNVKKWLVKKGFYPVYYSRNVNQGNLEIKGKDISVPAFTADGVKGKNDDLYSKSLPTKATVIPKDNNTAVRRGVFFNFAGLPKGSHHWDFSMSMRNQPSKRSSDCAGRIVTPKNIKRLK